MQMTPTRTPYLDLYISRRTPFISDVSVEQFENVNKGAS